MLHLAALLATLAPAPFLKPTPDVARAVLAAPGVAPADLAARLSSEGFLRAALKVRLPCFPPAVPPGWIGERLRFTPQLDGKSVEVALIRCTPDEALALLEVIAEEHLRTLDPARRKFMRRAEEEARVNLKGIPAKHRAMIREYFRRLGEKEGKAAVLAWPYLVPR